MKASHHVSVLQIAIQCSDNLSIYAGLVSVLPRAVAVTQHARRKKHRDSTRLGGSASSGRAARSRAALAHKARYTAQFGANHRACALPTQ